MASRVRRTEPLTIEQIVAAAVEMLDATGEGALTFRALADRLATGGGAIYWHVPSKGDLLAAATDAVVTAALVRPGTAASPQEEICAVALGLFDAFDEHPWLAGQLSARLARDPAATPHLLETFGQQVRAMGVPRNGQFTAASALLHYVLGAAGQNAANGVAHAPDRDEYLDAAARSWQELDPERYPFIRDVADQVRVHDDREQFLDGIRLILAGITTIHALDGSPSRTSRSSRP